MTPAVSLPGQTVIRVHILPSYTAEGWDNSQLPRTNSHGHGGRDGWRHRLGPDGGVLLSGTLFVEGQVRAGRETARGLVGGAVASSLPPLSPRASSQAPPRTPAMGPEGLASVRTWIKSRRTSPRSIFGSGATGSRRWLGELDLGDARDTPRLPEQLQQHRVFAGMDAFFHVHACGRAGGWKVTP